MGTFDASLRTLGDRKGLPATLTVADGRLAIEAGDQSIGEWSLDEIRLEPTPTGYRMAAEGEQILLDIENVDDFAHALNGKKVRVKKDKTEYAPKTEGKRVKETPVVEPKAAKPPKSAKESKHAAPSTEDSGFLSTILGFLDSTLDAASEKWGNLFPAWAFTRGVVYLLLGVFAVVVAFPGVIFWILLIGGVLMVMFGAVVYTDQVAAARWLPGRMTSMHILIFGVGAVVLAVFVGVASANRLMVILLGLALAAGAVMAARFTRKTAA